MSYGRRPSREILVQEFKIVFSRTQVLGDRHSEEGDNLDEDLNIEDKELQLNREQYQTTDHPIRNSVTHMNVKAVIWFEMEK